MAKKPTHIKELGPRLLTPFSDQYWADQAQLNMSFARNLRTSLVTRFSYLNSDKKMPFVSRVFVFLEWLIALQFLQSLADRLFIRAGDTRFVNYKNYHTNTVHETNLSWKNWYKLNTWSWSVIGFQLRHAVHRLITLPLTLLNTLVHAIISPLDSLRILTRPLKFQAQDQYNLALKQLSLNPEKNKQIFAWYENKDKIVNLQREKLLPNPNGNNFTEALNQAIHKKDESSCAILLNNCSLEQRFNACKSTHTNVWNFTETTLYWATLHKAEKTIALLVDGFSEAQITELLSQKIENTHDYDIVGLVQHGTPTIINTLLPKNIPEENNPKNDPQINAFLRVLNYLSTHQNDFTNPDLCFRLCFMRIEDGILRFKNLVMMACENGQIKKLSGVLQHLPESEDAQRCLQRCFNDQNGQLCNISFDKNNKTYALIPYKPATLLRQYGNNDQDADEDIFDDQSLQNQKSNSGNKSPRNR